MANEEGEKDRAAGRRRRESLLAEEQRVERDRFRQGHADDGLDEDLPRRTGVATDALDGLRADKAYANCGGETAEGALDAAGHFSDNCDHGVYLVGWIAVVRTQGTLPTGNSSVRGFVTFRVVVAGFGVIVAVIADQPNVHAHEQSKHERLHKTDQQL